MSKMTQVEAKLKFLKLRAWQPSIERHLQASQRERLSHLSFLDGVLSDEIERRQNNGLQRRIREAKFHRTYRMTDFDFSFNSSISEAQIQELASGHFISRKESVVLIGPCGVGKSHLSSAMGLQACIDGHRVRYTHFDELMDIFRYHRAQGEEEKALKYLMSHELLVIDDVGLRSWSEMESSDMFMLMCEAYEKLSLIITSNLHTEEWFGLFHHPLQASAALDRVLHHAHVMAIEGESYRAKHRISSRSKP